jgi:hypothetical protein
MRQGSSAPSTPLHHRPHSLPQGSTPSLRRLVWRGIVALARRPLLALTLCLVAVLLFGTASEAMAAHSLETRAAAQHWHNADLRAALSQTSQEIHLSQSPAAITAAALKLGMIMPTNAP